MALQEQIAVSAGNAAYMSNYPLKTTGIAAPVDVTAPFTLSFWMFASSIAATSGGAQTASSMFGVYNGTALIGTGTTTGLQMGMNQGNTGSTSPGTVCCWTWGGANLVVSNGQGLTGTIANSFVVTASIAGTVMTVTAVTSGTIVPGQGCSGANVLNGTQIMTQLTGTAGSTGTYRVNLFQTAASATVNGLYIAPINTWVHVAYTSSVSSNGIGTAGTQTHSLYINGLLNNTNSNAIQIAGVPTLIYLNGYPQSLANTGFESNKTAVDDCEFFNRALSAAEIATLYNCYGSRDGIVLGLVARYEFNELPAGSSVMSCTDFSGNNNELTLTVVGTGVAPTYTIFPISNSNSRFPHG